MSREMDAFFSERLRKYWKSPAAVEDDRTLQEKEGTEPGAALESLRRSIKDHYSGDDLFALTVLLDELASLLNLLLPGGADPDSTDKIISEMHEALNRLEDLLESFELKNRIKSTSR